MAAFVSAWMCQLAEKHDVIKGVVAGVDVTCTNVRNKHLDRFPLNL